MPDTVLPVNSNSSASSPASPSSGSPRTPISIVLFDGFEPLDVFGPVEVLGDLEDCELHYYSLTGGSVGSMNVARSAIFSGSKTITSASAPGVRRPLLLRPSFSAGITVAMRTAS